MILSLFNAKRVKFIGLIALGSMAIITFFILTGWVANALPEAQLTALPYTWYMIAARLMVYGALFYRYRHTRYTFILLLLIAVGYEFSLNDLYHSAEEGLLW